MKKYDGRMGEVDEVSLKNTGFNKVANRVETLAKLVFSRSWLLAVEIA